MMTDLEALKHASNALHHLAKQAASEIDKHILQEAEEHLDVIIAEVEEAEADPEIALEQAEHVAQAAGRYITFWFSRSWLIDQLVDEDIDATDEIVNAAAQHIMASEDIGSTEAALIALLEWTEAYKAGQAKAA